MARGATPKDEPDHLRLAAEHLDRADEPGALPHLKAHLRQQPDAVMVRAYLGELLMKTGNLPESKLHFEQFTREAAEGSAAAKKHLVHAHTRLMELAGQTDDTFGEQLHRGIGLVLLVKQWRDDGEPADAALTERTLVAGGEGVEKCGLRTSGRCPRLALLGGGVVRVESAVVGSGGDPKSAGMPARVDIESI